MVHDSQAVLLATALGSVYDCHGQVQQCRMLCDPGLQLSFVSKKFAKGLGLVPGSRCFPVEGIGPATVMTGGCLFVDLESIHPDRSAVHVELHILDSICPTLPNEAIEMQQWLHLKDLQLADPNFNSPGPIDVLLGADVWGMVLRDGVVSGQRDEPCAMRTCFGWVVFGRTRQTVVMNPRSHLSRVTDDVSLVDLIKRYWELEEPPMEVCSPNDKCEEIFVTTVTREEGGR